MKEITISNVDKKLLTIQSCADSNMSINSTVLNKYNSDAPGIRTQDVRAIRGIANALIH